MVAGSPAAAEVDGRAAAAAVRSLSDILAASQAS